MTLLTSKLPCDDRRTILRGQETGQWLSVLPSTVNDTELSAVEFRDALNLRYARTLEVFNQPVMVATNSSGFTMHLSAKKAVLSSHVTKRSKTN